MADKKPTTKVEPKFSYTSFQDMALKNEPLMMGFLFLSDLKSYLEHILVIEGLAH